MNILKDMVIDRIKPDGSGFTVAAGATDVNGDVVDTAGYEGVVFITAFGAITSGAVTSTKVQQGQQSNLSDAADLEGSSITVADTDDNKVTLIEIHQPRERYLRQVTKRATQNAVIDGQWVIKYGSRVKPVTQGTNVINTEVHISPAEGTA